MIIRAMLKLILKMYNGYRHRLLFKLKNVLVDFAADMTKYEINSDSDEDVPFRCIICRETFVNPVVTK